MGPVKPCARSASGWKGLRSGRVRTPPAPCGASARAGERLPVPDPPPRGTAPGDGKARQTRRSLAPDGAPLVTLPSSPATLEELACFRAPVAHS